MTADGELPLSRRNGKSEAAFRTISEVAEELDVPQHVLRFWESKFPQVKPLKRGGGRRYYRPEDVALLRRIRDLLYSEGYTIKGVQKLLKEGGILPKEPTAPAAAAAVELSLPIEDAEDEEAEGEYPAEGEDGLDQDDAEPAEDEGHAEPPVPLEFLLERQEIPAEQGGEPVPATAGGALGPAVRRELEEILAELEQLRGLLQPRQR